MRRVGRGCYWRVGWHSESQIVKTEKGRTPHTHAHTESEWPAWNGDSSHQTAMAGGEQGAWDCQTWLSRSSLSNMSTKSPSPLSTQFPRPLPPLPTPLPTPLSRFNMINSYLNSGPSHMDPHLLGRKECIGALCCAQEPSLPIQSSRIFPLKVLKAIYPLSLQISSFNSFNLHS